MTESPIARLLTAFDLLDVDAVAALLAPECRLLMADGRREEGEQEIRQLLAGTFSVLRSAAHTIVAEWHLDGVWIAEVQANFVLQDWLELKELPRAVIVREGPRGISSLHVYGAHEHPLAEHRTGGEGMWLGGRWIPPL